MVPSLKLKGDCFTAHKNLEDNLALLKQSITALDTMVNGATVDVEAAEVGLHLLRDQHKKVLRLIDHYVAQLRAANLDFEAKIQIGRRVDLIRGMAFITRHCNQKLVGATVATTTPTTAANPHPKSSFPKRESPKLGGIVREWLTFSGTLETSTAAAKEEESVSPINKNKNKNNSSATKTAAGFTKTPGQRGKGNCIFCPIPGHTATDCRAATKMSLEARKQAIQDHRACFNCFRVGHGSDKCKVKMTCIFCGNHHHVMVCHHLNSKESNLPKKEEQPLQQSSSSSASPTSSSSQIPAPVPMPKPGIHEGRKIEMEVSTGPGVPRNSGPIACNQPDSYQEECKQMGITSTDQADDSEEKEVLIRANHCEFLKLGEKSIPLKNGPEAIHKKLGWTVSGRQESPPPPVRRMTMLTLQATTEKNLNKLWALEILGIMDPAETKTRQEVEQSAQAHFHKPVKQEPGSHHTLYLPCIEGYPELRNNKSIAVSRLHTPTRLLKQQGTLGAFGQVFKTWEEEEHKIEKPPAAPSTTLFYPPRRAVIKEGFTTPIRLVFDVSVKSRFGPSIKDVLETGPNLIKLISSILTLFHPDKVVAVADITKAFQEMSVEEGDREKFHFLWWEDLPTCSKIKEYRHTRVVFGGSCSQYLLCATLQHHINQYPHFPAPKKKLLSCHHVDNTVVSLPHMEDAIQFQRDAQDILSTGQLDLRGWEFGPSSHEEKTKSVLGLLGDLKDDYLHIELKPPALITTAEADRVEATLIRFIQSSVIPKNYKKLPAFLDDGGIVRLKTQLLYGEEDEASTKPGNHPLEKLLISHEHKKSHHAGVQYCQVSLREKYWTTDSCRTIHTVIHLCPTCRHHFAAKGEVPLAALPPERVNTTRALSITGVDVTGPLCERRGRPTAVFSNNKTNFVGACKLLRNVDQKSRKISRAPAPK